MLGGFTCTPEDMAALFEVLPYGVIVRDSQGQVVFANAKAAEVVQMGADKLKGTRKLFGDMFHTLPSGTECRRNSKRSFGHPFQEAVTTGRPVHKALVKIEGRDGTHRWVRAHWTPVLDESGGVRYVVTSFVEAGEPGTNALEDRLRNTVFQSVAGAKLLLESYLQLREQEQEQGQAQAEPLTQAVEGLKSALSELRSLAAGWSSRPPLA